MSDRILPPARHETRDIAFRPMLAAAVLMGLTLAAIALLVWWLFPHSMTDVVVSGPVPDFPAPRLQTSPSKDMAQFYAEEMRHLDSYGWVDRAQGIVHIPIAQAMQQVVQHGIADWPAPHPGAAK